jgi:hypothetical protein
MWSYDFIPPYVSWRQSLTKTRHCWWMLANVSYTWVVWGCRVIANLLNYLNFMELSPTYVAVRLSSFISLGSCNHCNLSCFFRSLNSKFQFLPRHRFPSSRRLLICDLQDLVVCSIQDDVSEKLVVAIFESTLQKLLCAFEGKISCVPPPPVTQRLPASDTEASAK